MQMPTSLAEVVKLAAAKAKANGGKLVQDTLEEEAPGTDWKASDVFACKAKIGICNIIHVLYGNFGDDMFFRKTVVEMSERTWS